MLKILMRSSPRFLPSSSKVSQQKVCLKKTYTIASSYAASNGKHDSHHRLMIYHQDYGVQKKRCFSNIPQMHIFDRAGKKRQRARAALNPSW